MIPHELGRSIRRNEITSLFAENWKPLPHLSTVHPAQDDLGSETEKASQLENGSHQAVKWHQELKVAGAFRLATAPTSPCESIPMA